MLEKRSLSNNLVFIASSIFLFLFSIVLLILFFKIDGRSVLEIFHPSVYNYFELLSKSFLEGRLDITPKGEYIHDLSIYNDKYYLYWPPMPSIVLTPLVFLFGSELPSKILVLSFGALNLFLFLKVAEGFVRYLKLELSRNYLLLLGFFWSVGTVNFNVSFDGSVWYISQVMSQTFLLTSFIFIFKEKPKLLLSGIFFAMAVYTRNTMVFIGLVYLVILLQMNQYNIKKTLVQALYFGTPFLLCSFANMAYNYARFDNPFDNGLTKHNMGWWFRKSYEEYGYFNLHFFPHNFHYEIIKAPTFLNHFPFIGFDLEGFGMLWASPLFLLMPLALTALSLKSDVKTKQLAWVSLVAIIPIAMLIFMIMGRGVQFGARYSLDYYILLFFGLLYIFARYQHHKLFKPLILVLFAISIYINIVGAYYMALR